MAKSSLDTTDRQPLLLWLIFTGVCVFAAILLWHFGLIRLMVESDRTYISSVIVLFYLVTTLHCLWSIVAVSREDAVARQAALPGAPPAHAGSHASPGLIGDFLSELAEKATLGGSHRPDPTALLRSLATRLRAPNRFGDFASDTLMKLGLVGTIIGFIIMLAPIATLDTADRGAIKVSMNLMSGGMAVAMYTTLAGLVGSILVKIQYYMLEDATARLFLRAVALGDAGVAPSSREIATDARP
jgi:hypothetical protein